MQRSESVTNLMAALIKFQSMVGKPPKNKVATIYTPKGSYSYKYADLESIHDTIKEPLAKCGLGILQDPVKDENGETKGVKTIVFHESGEYIEFEPVIIPSESKAHGIGSALSYARRYSLCLALGIVAEDDDDAAQTMQPVLYETNPKSQQPQQQPPQNVQNINQATTEQRKKLFAVAKKEKGLSDDQIKILMKLRTGKESTQDLTRNEIRDLIKHIEKTDTEKLILEIESKKTLETYQAEAK